MKPVLHTFLLLLFVQTAWAAEESVTAKVNRTEVPLNGVVLLDITVFNTSAEPPDLVLDGFDVSFAGKSSSVQIFNMQMSSSTTYQFRLQPLREGSFEIPPIVVEGKNKRLSTDPIRITVVPPQAVTSPSGSLPRLQTGRGNVVDIEDILTLTMSPERPEITVGETVRVKIQLLAKHVEVVLDSISQLEAEGLVFSRIEAKDSRSLMIGGEPHFLYELETVVSALRAGEYTLGPVTLTCEIPVPDRSDPFGGGPFGSVFSRAFSRRIPVQVQSDQAVLKVNPLPSENRPEHFRGAVGIFNMQVRANPRTVEVGDPITVTIDINGEGNFAAISAPHINPDGPFRIYDPRLVSSPEQGSSRGTKRFEVVMMPTSTAAKFLPPIEFSYYDPSRREYVTQREEAITIQVHAADEAASAASVTASVIDKVETVQGGRQQIVGIQTRLGPKPKAVLWRHDGTWWLLCLLPLVLLAAGEAIRRRRRYLLENPAGWRAARARGQAQRALRQCSGMEAPYPAIAKALQHYVAAVTNRKAEGLTAREMQEALQALGVTTQTLQELQQVMAACDAARFAPQVSTQKAEAAVHQAERVVRQIERERK